MRADILKEAVDFMKRAGCERFEVQCEMFGSHLDIEVFLDEETDFYYWDDSRWIIEKRNGEEIRIPYENIMEVFTHGENICDVHLRS